LRATRDFELVHRRGKRHSGDHFTLWVLSRQPGSTKIGITTSRKVGNAVRRNRFRRLIRESLRPLVSKISEGYKIVVVVRARANPKSPVPSFAEVGLEVLRLLKSSGLLVG
jgi:ribonuclease P protein component